MRDFDKIVLRIPAEIKKTFRRNLERSRPKDRRGAVRRYSRGRREERNARKKQKKKTIGAQNYEYRVTTTMRKKFMGPYWVSFSLNKPARLSLLRPIYLLRYGVSKRDKDLPAY